MQEKKRKEHLFSITKKDFDINYFSGTGAGGQFMNKHQNCVRLKHKASGARGTGQSHRNRKTNLQEALNSLTESSRFKLWINRKAYEVLEGKTIEQKVDESMKSENIKVEVKDDDNRWKEE